MIRNSLLYGALLIVLYVALVEIVHWPAKSMSQWEDNTQAVEYFLFETDKEKVNTIIVGSSLSYRMTAEKSPCPDSVVNLALGGMSLYDGSNIMKRSGVIPKYLFVEVNVIYREPKTNYADQFFVPGVYQLNSSMLGFRDQYRPLTFAQYIFMGVKNRLNSSHYSERKTKSLVASVQSSNNEANDKTIDLKAGHKKMTLESYKKILKDTDWQYVFTKFEKELDYFRQQGTKIILFEMPTSKEVLDSELNLNIRNHLRDKSYWRYIQAQPSYPTTDGVHISVRNANDFMFRLLPLVNGKDTK